MVGDSEYESFDDGGQSRTKLVPSLTMVGMQFMARDDIFVETDIQRP